MGTARNGRDSDADRVKSHAFFSSINWSDLHGHSVPPPFVPGSHQLPCFDDIHNLFVAFADPEEVYAKDEHKFRADTLGSNTKVCEIVNSDAKNHIECYDSQIQTEHAAAFSAFQGVASHSWQHDVLETVFDELNPFTATTTDLLVCTVTRTSHSASQASSTAARHSTGALVSAVLLPKGQPVESMLVFSSLSVQPPTPTFDANIFDMQEALKRTRRRASSLLVETESLNGKRLTATSKDLENNTAPSHELLDIPEVEEVDVLARPSEDRSTRGSDDAGGIRIEYVYTETDAPAETGSANKDYHDEIVIRKVSAPVGKRLTMQSSV